MFGRTTRRNQGQTPSIFVTSAPTAVNAALPSSTASPVTEDVLPVSTSTQASPSSASPASSYDPEMPDLEPITTRPFHRRLTAANVLAKLDDPASESLYLGNPDTVDKVQWVQHGGKQVLVRIPLTADAEDNEEDDAKADDAEDAVETGGDEPQAYEEAILSVVGFINEDKFYITPDGDYNPNAPFGDRGLPSSNATCVLSKPAFGDVEPLWDAYIPALTAIQAKGLHLQPRIRSCFNANAAGGAICLKHRLFEDTSKDGTPDPFQSNRVTTEKWPVSRRNRMRYDEMLESGCYTAKPVNAYDLAQQELRPSEYEANLRGAIVEVYFTLHHWRWTKTTQSTFTAVLKEIQVRRSPLSVSPLKRSRSGSVSGPSSRSASGSPSPSKKSRLASA